MTSIYLLYFFFTILYMAVNMEYKQPHMVVSLILPYEAVFLRFLRAYIL